MSSQLSMEQALLPLVVLTMDTRRWSCQVLLVEKTHHRKSRSTGNIFQRYIFSDSEGTRIQAISYGEDATIVDKVLQLMHTYVVSNARMVLCNTEFKLVEHKFQWVLTTATAMELVTSSPLLLSLACPTFIPFKRLEEYKGTTENIDILALAIDKSTKRSITTQHGTATVQDIVLITPEKIPTVLSLWNDYIETEGAAILPVSQTPAAFTIVAALRVRVQSFRGVSLSAKGFANIIIDPPYVEAASLKQWATDNQDYLQTVVASRAYFSSPRGAPNMGTSTATTIAAVLSASADGHFTVRGRAALKQPTQSYYYMGCSGCYKMTTATEHTDFTCHYCNRKAQASPRLKYSIQIYDDTGELDVVVFGNLAEQLLGTTADSLLATSKEGGGLNVNVDQINARLAGCSYRFEIRKKQSSVHNNDRFYYTMVNFGPAEAEHTSHSDKSNAESSSRVRPRSPSSPKNSPQKRVCLHKTASHIPPTSDQESTDSPNLEAPPASGSCTQQLS